jgi:FAD/FMN-containing dehydrogenase
MYAAPVAVRGGGHSVAGNGTCDGGLLLDLSLLKGVHVDPRNRIARAGGGVVWGEFDRETEVFGLATPGGRVTTTGVAGFATGGGYGWLSPKFGLTCDNIMSATVVTAEGTVVVASEHENEDLLFGIRGGSSNFGVVTSFEFRLHPVGPILYGGIAGYGIDRAPDVLRSWRDFAEAAPNELGTGAVLLVAPPEEFVPEPLHHRPVLGIFALWVGSGPGRARAARVPRREHPRLRPDGGRRHTAACRQRSTRSRHPGGRTTIAACT